MCVSFTSVLEFYVPLDTEVTRRHLGDESFRAITCTGTDNTKQTGENTPETEDKHKMNNMAVGKKTQTRLNSTQVY